MRDEYEKLGVFYLGRGYDVGSQKPAEDLVLFESKKLVTHGLVVGMTGSGKTGLCVGLMEEAAMDGLPAIMVDPKGDLGNLLLTFPELSGEDFRPWVDAQEAVRRGVSIEQYAQTEADKWRKGLEQTGQDSERIKHLRKNSNITIYTPGSNVGVPVSILGSLQIPNAAVLADEEALQSRVSSTVAGILSLAGVKGELLNSREVVLLSTILHESWSAGENLDLAGLLQKLQNPGFEKIGVLDLESYFPAKERFELAIQLNNLLAMPSFKRWMEGQPLNIGELLYTKEGKPRQAIFSISHLNDAERMFFVTLLLNEVLSWARTQSGTSSLRALLYIDEIFGYFPPVANPPSKQPLLTLLKQGRAFGLGVVLATQNPADLDYKGLSNIGTWFVGRLQTGRDRSKVLDGLEGAASGKGQEFDRQEMDQLIASLPGRVFLLHSVHEEVPVTFQTRWAMSYLRGPLSQDEMRKFRKIEPNPVEMKEVRVAQKQSTGPVLAPEIPQFWLPAAPGAYFEPRIMGYARVQYSDAKTGLDVTAEVCLLAPVEDGVVAVDWENAEEKAIDLRLLRKEPVEGDYAALPQEASRAEIYKQWSREFVTWIRANKKLQMWKAPEYKMISTAEENEASFRQRVVQRAREERDAAAEHLKAKYGTKVGGLEERIRKAEAAKQRETEQAGRAKMDALVSLGSTLLGAFLGKKKVTSSNVGRAASTMKGAGRAYGQSKDVERAGETVEALREQLKELEDQLRSDLEKLHTAHELPEITSVDVPAKKTDVQLKAFALVWVPIRKDEYGGMAMV